MNFKAAWASNNPLDSTLLIDLSNFGFHSLQNPSFSILEASKQIS